MCLILNPGALCSKSLGGTEGHSPWLGPCQKSFQNLEYLDWLKIHLPAWSNVFTNLVLNHLGLIFEHPYQFNGTKIPWYSNVFYWSFIWMQLVETFYKPIKHFFTLYEVRYDCPMLVMLLLKVLQNNFWDAIVPHARVLLTVILDMVKISDILLFQFFSYIENCSYIENWW